MGRPALWWGIAACWPLGVIRGSCSWDLEPQESQESKGHPSSELSRYGLGSVCVLFIPRGLRDFLSYVRYMQWCPCLPLFSPPGIFHS